MYLETLTIDQLMDTIANLGSDEGEILSVTPTNPAPIWEDAPEAQNDANLDPTWEDPGEADIPNWCYLGKMVDGRAILYPAKQVWGE